VGSCYRGVSYDPERDLADGDEPGTLRLLRANNIQRSVLNTSDLQHVAGRRVSPRQGLRPGDVLICAANGSRRLVGKAARFDLDDGLPYTFGAFMNCYRPDQSKVNAQFVIQLFQTKRYRDQVDVALSGSSINNLGPTQIESMIFPMPPLPEQATIAAVLIDADSLARSLEPLAHKKRDLRQAALHQLLTGKTRLPGFEGEWHSKKLDEIGRFSKGRGIRKDQVSADGLPCVRYGELYTRHSDYVREFYSFISPDVASQSQRLRTGDLLFAGSGETAEEIGKCAAFLGHEEAYGGGDIVILRPVGQDPKFLGYLMNHAAVVEQKSRFGQGDAVVHISARNLAEIAVELPPLDEQGAITAVLSDMDDEIAALEARLAKMRDLKQAMAQELLTGRTRLA
jgi:type I restriction enzyme, S subunit